MGIAYSIFGDGHRHHVYPLFLQFNNFVRGRIAANRAFGHFTIVDFPRFFGKCIADIFGIGDDLLDELADGLMEDGLLLGFGRRCRPR